MQHAVPAILFSFDHAPAPPTHPENLWSAAAERSGDAAFTDFARGEPKRCRASLATALQKSPISFPRSQAGALVITHKLDSDDKGVEAHDFQ